MKYVMVTAVSTYRMRYCISVDDLKSKNPTYTPTDDELLAWGKDGVTCEDYEEFSQEWLGETIVDAEFYDQDGMLSKFDQDNDYLASWDKDKKINFVQNNSVDKQERYYDYMQRMLKEQGEGE